jgi:hypothetical protein
MQENIIRDGNIQSQRGILNIEYKSFCTVVGIWSHHPLPRKRVCPPPHLGPPGGATLACGGWGRRTKVQRRDRHSGTCNVLVRIL